MLVPIFFIILSIVGFYFSGLTGDFVFQQMILRLARNLVLVMSLMIPIISGMGLNFGIVLGAMAGQIGIIVIMNNGYTGFNGFLIAVLVATPIAIILGYLVGKILNKAKGKEMITSMILGFFANGIYQLIFIIFAGTLIPFKNKDLLRSSGDGLRNTIDLISIKSSLDNLLFPNSPYPIMTFVVIILLFVGIYLILKTKVGQEMRAVGQSMHIASVSGIDVDKTRIIAIIISTVLAAWGQLIYLQNMGTFNTYNNHEQVGLFAVASILIGGASVNKVSWKEVVLGTFLFHLLFIVSPLAGQNIAGDAQIGEYFRVFIAYGVIGVALILHSWEENKKKSLNLNFDLNNS